MSKQDEFIEACKQGNIDIVNKLLKKTFFSGTVSINKSDNQGTPPLLYSVKNGHLNLVKLLLEKGADVDCKNQHGEYPLATALKPFNDDNYEDYLKIFELLISNGANVNVVTAEGYSLLTTALELGCPKATELLIENGADLNVKGRNGQSPFTLAAASKFDFYTKVMELLISKRVYINPTETYDAFLWNAVSKSRNETAKLFIKLGANVNMTEKGQSLLEIAMVHENIELINFMIPTGVDVNAICHFGLRTPIMLAAQDGLVEIAEMLINSGADVNAQVENYGFTPLHFTCWETWDETVKSVLDNEIRKANYDAIRREEIGSPEYYRELEKQLEGVNTDSAYKNDFKDSRIRIAQLLIDKGADLNAKDIDGLTPFQHAKQNGHVEMMAFLEKAQGSLKI